MKFSIYLNLLIGLVICGVFFSCSTESREDFYQAIEKQIADIDVKIKELQAKAATLAEDAKPEIEKAIAKLKELKQSAQEKLKALKASSDSAWQDMKPALSEAMKDLETGFQKAKEHFK